MSAIFKREFGAYFSSPVGYTVLAAFMFFSGLFLYVYCLYPGISSMSSVFKQMFSAVIFVIPIITMRSFSEDKKMKTDRLLMTSPVSMSGIVAGKFFSALALFSICLGAYIIEGVTLSFFSHPDWAVIIGNIFAMLVMGSAFIAIGMFVSSLTESVVTAAVVSFAINMIISFLDAISSTISWEPLAAAVRAVSFQSRYNSFALGLIPFSDVVFFLSVTFLFLFLTDRVIEKKRWS